MKIFLWFLSVAVFDLSVAGYFLYACNYHLDVFTLGIAILLQIYAVLQICRVEWFMDFGGRYQGALNVLLIILSLNFLCLGFAWQTHLGKLTQYHYCVPKSVSDEAMQVLIGPAD